MPIHAVKLLVNAAIQAPSADNSQPWHYTWNGDFLTFSYDTDRVYGLTFSPDDPATLLSLGGAIENVIQVADHYGIQIEFEKIIESKIKTGASFRLRPDTDNIANLADEHTDLPLFHRHTNRLSYKNKALSSSLIAWINTDCELNARATVTTNSEKIKGIADLVRNASEIRFQTKEVHEWLGKSLRFSPTEVEYGDGLDVATLGLPRGGTLLLKFISDWRRMVFLNRFKAYKLLSMIDSLPVGKASALVIITSPEGPEQVIDAGRLLTRIWTRLNMEGVAVHPYYVIPDQLQRLKQNRIPDKLVSQARYLERAAGHIFGLDEKLTELRMVLRIGYPKKKPIRSKRLPLEAVFTDIT